MPSHYSSLDHYIKIKMAPKSVKQPRTEKRYSFSDHDYTIAAKIDLDEEIDVVGNDNTIATSQHDSANNGLQQQDLEDDEGDVRMWQSPRNLRRTIKKPQIFKPMSTNKQMPKKRGRSLSVSVHTTQAKNSGKKVKEEEEKKYEVDYIFGKRPDKKCNGKMEYRVMWKNFSKEEATWEPEKNLRKCPETIEAYERGQSIGHNEKESKGKEQHSDSDAEEDAEDNLTMRNKTIKRGKHNVKSSLDDKKMKEKKRVLPTMRARESTPNKKVIKEFSPAHSSTSSSHDSGKSKKNSVPNKTTRGKKSKSQKPSTSQATERISKEPTDAKLRSEDILLVESVMQSDIDGVGLIASIILNNGIRKRVTKKIIQKMVPDLLIEYYESSLKLYDI